MKALFTYLIIVTLCLLSSSIQCKQTYSTFSVRHIGYADGLSSLRVFSIVEDKNHAMWVATKAGIDRYNGQSIKSYVLPGEFKYGDMAGRRLKLFYDSKERLWVYDNAGKIYLYSSEKDRFEQMYALSSHISGEIILNKLCVDAGGEIWLGLSQGLYRMGADGFVSLVVPGKYVNELLVEADRVYVGTATGLTVYDRMSSSVKEEWVKGSDIQTLFFEKGKNRLWMGTFNSGLLRLNIQTKKMTTICESNSAFSNPIRAISDFNAESVLVGIDGGGVYAVAKKGISVTPLFITGDNENRCLKGNGIYAVTKDFQGNIWMGSYTGGVSVAIVQKYPIGVYTHEDRNPHSLMNNNVNGILENYNGDLWFATDQGISIQQDSSKWKHVLQSNVVVSLSKDKKGQVWAGTYGGGVYLLDEAGKVLSHFTKQDGILTTNYIFSIAVDSMQNVWIGGLDGDLISMKPHGERIASYDVNWIHSVQTVNSHEMAVATVDGFCLVDIQTGKVTRYATSSEFKSNNASAYIISMLFNGDGTVWLGTEDGGLSLYNMHKRSVRSFTTQEGMPSNDVYSIHKDVYGRIWASTGKGLALLENEQVSDLSFLQEINREYNKSSFTRLSDGQYAFGSTSGAVCLYPHLVTRADYQAPLRFSGFTIDNIGEKERKEMTPLICQMLLNREMELDYSQNSFTIDFESINYQFQQDIVYQYMLDGYEKTWSSASFKGSVKYSKVSPGSYLLKVRSLRKSNSEIIDEQILPIRIFQPWWNSGYAWVTYLCLLGGIFYFILRYNSNRMQKQYDEDKIRFFIDTAHDIRTPVTLIMSPLEDLTKEELTPDARYYLNLARTNTQKLHDLVGQLLEFERLDQGKYTVQWTPLSLNELLGKEVAEFQSYAKKKELDVNLVLPKEDVCVLADRKLMEMILDNLLSNACKYTPRGGKVSIQLSFTKKKACIQVEDTGIGIPHQEQKHLFTSVYRAENARKSNADGSGFGLLQVYRLIKMLHGQISFRSVENVGTAFSLVFNLTDRHPEAAADEAVKEPIAQGKIESYTDVALPEGVENDAEVAEHPQETLLIVEDNDALRHYLQMIFRHSYRVIEAATGEEALACLEKEYPDIIVSDVMMPGIQGDELCERVKANPETASIPFVLLTAKTTHDAMADGLRKGADDYIPKPFHTDILQLKVRGLLANRERQRQWLMRHALLQVGQQPAEDVAVAVEEAKRIDETVQPAELSESDKIFVEQATQVVLNNISNQEFTINELCQEMAMSRTLFYGRLKSLTGKAPQEFIRLIRLQKAAELLMAGKSVADVSVETGFVNTKYFSILFKKQFGVQPSKYANTEV